MEKGSAEYKELVQEIADAVKPIILSVDIMRNQFTGRIDLLKEVVESMRDGSSTLKALPFPETMAKAELMQNQEDQMEKIIELVEIRAAGWKIAQDQAQGTPGNDVLRQMGLL